MVLLSLRKIDLIMNIKKVKTAGLCDAAGVPALLDSNMVEWNTVGCCCWAESFPYQPKVEFRLAYTDDELLVHFRVEEDSVRARYGEDNGRVWTDSCVEMFLSPEANDTYYNIECNCIGTVLLGVHEVESTSVTDDDTSQPIWNKERAPAEVLSGIERWSSLGREPFEERLGKTAWQVALRVPYSTFWHHRFRPSAGTVVSANFQKCGDELAKPHFLTWAPIIWEKPNFHLPQFFEKIIFC